MKKKNTHHNSERAAKSIGTKFATLERWIETGVPIKKDGQGNELFKNGEPVYIDIPTSLNKFLRWADARYGIMSTSQSALTNYLSSVNKDGGYVEILLRQTKHKLEQQKLSHNKSDLKIRLNAAMKLINEQNEDITKYFLENKHLEGEIKALTAEVENIEMAASLKHEAMQATINRLNEQLSRVRNMRIVDDKK